MASLSAGADSGFLARLRLRVRVARYGGQALHEVPAVTVLDAVRVVAESGKAPIPGPERAQVTQIRTVDVAGGFARHQHRDAWRIRHDAGGADAVGEIVERPLFDRAADRALTSVVRVHHGHRQR